MSLMKDIDENENYYKRIAYTILKQIGAIESCACGAFHWNRGWEEQKVYALATNEFKNRKEDKNYLTLFRAKIKEILSDDYIEGKCPYCEDNEDNQE